MWKLTAEDGGAACHSPKRELRPSTPTAQRTGSREPLMRVLESDCRGFHLGKKHNGRARGSSRSVRHEESVHTACAPGSTGSPTPRFWGLRSPTKSANRALGQTRSYSECYLVSLR